MLELRSVDPRTLKPNPNEPRRTPATEQENKQLLASILAIGFIEPPVVREVNGQLELRSGQRRTNAAIEAGFSEMVVIVTDADIANDPMVSLAANIVNAPMNLVDTWRAVEKLEKLNWTDQAIADAIAQPVRTIQKLKLLARVHPPMLDAIAAGMQPNNDQLRTIANADRADQAALWKKYKPKKGETSVEWHLISRGLHKARIPFATAKFDATLAAEFGITWHDDLFAPAGQDGRYTTDTDAFFGAQQEWLTRNIPAKNAAVVTIDDNGRPALPKGAVQTWSKPTKTDTIGHYVDSHTGEVKTIAYSVPEKKPVTRNGGAAEQPTPATPRPDVTQRGTAMIGDFRTSALHEALATADISDHTLIALLVMGFAASNVSVQSALPLGHNHRQQIRNLMLEGGALTADPDTIRSAARTMLSVVLSCRDNGSNSGMGALIAGDTIGASTHLPTMATDEFLGCLSRPALEGIATKSGVRTGARVKDTRAAVVSHFAGGVYHLPAARFAVPPATVEEDMKRTGVWSETSAADPYGIQPQADADGTDEEAEPETGPEDQAEPNEEPETNPGVVSGSSDTDPDRQIANENAEPYADAAD